MSKNYIKVTFEAWPCELRNSLLRAMQCNICKYCIMVTVICVKYAWHKDGAVLNIDMIQQTCICWSNSKICWFFNDLIHGRERWVGSIWIVLNVNIKIPTNHAVLAMLRMIYFVEHIVQLDTWACQFVGHFFQAICPQCTKPSPWTVGHMDECMTWQEYPLASMLAEGN